tara:strand:- start:74 stop:928 length:855 start_codon:yes stop_codon:yes gene_type:complete
MANYSRLEQDFVGLYNEREKKKIDPKKVYAKIREIKKDLVKDPRYKGLSSDDKETAVMMNLANEIEEKPETFYSKRKLGRSPSLKPGTYGGKGVLPWNWHGIRGIKRLFHKSRGVFGKSYNEDTFNQLRALAKNNEEIFPEDLMEDINTGARSEAYVSALEILNEGGLLTRRGFTTRKHDLEVSGKKAGKRISKKLKESGLEQHVVETILAIILLVGVTFSLVISVVDNPTITGAAVFGITQGGSTTLILNLLAFIIVVLLIYPSSQVFKTKTKKKSRSRKRRK